MPPVTDLLQQMRAQPQKVRFADVLKVCEAFFGTPRRAGGCHIIFKTPWPGDPCINIQSSKGFAKAYQVRQVLLAIDKLLQERR